VNWLNALLKKNNKRIGLQLDGDTLSYCLVDVSGPQPSVISVGQATLDSGDKIKESFANCISEIGAKGADAYWVIPSEFYRIIAMEKPAVPETEIKEAIRWQIKEQIDFNVEDAAIDYFGFPEALPGAAKINVVVCHKSAVETLVDLTLEAGLTMQVIDISELAVGNLLLSSFQDGQNTGFLAENSKGIVVNCFMGSDFSFTRSLAGVFMPREKDDSNEFSLDVDLGSEDQYDQLLLEIQRTLDYYESQIARQSITRLVIPDLGAKTESFSKLLAENLGIKVDKVQLAELMTWDESSVNNSALSQFLHICGCCLRDKEMVHAAN